MGLLTLASVLFFLPLDAKSGAALAVSHDTEESRGR